MADDAPLTGLEKRVNSALSSFHTLFTDVSGSSVAVIELPDKDAIHLYYSALSCLASELSKTIASGNRSPARFDSARHPDAADYFNQFCRHNSADVGRFLSSSLFALLAALPDIADAKAALTERSKWLLRHARNVFANPLDELLKSYAGAAPAGELSRLFFAAVPPVDAQLNLADWTSDEFVSYIRARIASEGRVVSFSAFKYAGSRLAPYELTDRIKPPDQFFGYNSAKRRIAGHFGAFAAGKPVKPLIMDGPPGTGKTHLVLSYIRHYGLKLVVCSPECLGKSLPELFALSSGIGSRAVLLFDDIVPENVDWGDFTEYVDGTAKCPQNIALALITNAEFHERVYSRGEYVQPPKFSAGECMQIISGYLAARMKITDKDLLEQIGVSYISEYRGQRIPELSPRSLIGFLERVVSNEALRRQIFASMHSDRQIGNVHERFTDEMFDLAYRKGKLAGRA